MLQVKSVVIFKIRIELKIIQQYNWSFLIAMPKPGGIDILVQFPFWSRIVLLQNELKLIDQVDKYSNSAT